MTELQQNRYDRLLRRVGNLIGAKSMVNDALGELFPVMEVENVPAELFALMGTRLCFGTAIGLAGPGVRPQGQLFNPLGSGTIITLTRVIYVSDVTNIANWNINTTPFITLLARGSLRDTRLRLPSSTAAVGELRTQSSALPVGATGTARLLANTTLQLRDDNAVAVLTPGFGFNIESANLNSLMSATFYWRERTMEESEFLVGG